MHNAIKCYFEHFNVEDIKITSGTTVVPSTPYKLNFGVGWVMRAFTKLFEGIGISGEDKGNLINLQAFNNGSYYFSFELTPDGADGGWWNLQSDGTTSLDVTLEPIYLHRVWTFWYMRNGILS